MVRRLPITRLDVAARLVAGVLPRAATPHIDRMRLDARAVLASMGSGLPPVLKSASGQTAKPTPLDEIVPMDHLLPRRVAESLHQLGRDVAMIRGSLTGHTPPPTVDRPPSAYAMTSAPKTSTAALAQRRARVTFVRDETPDARSFGLAFEDGAPLEFEAGQFLSVELTIDGHVERRAYSLASAALPDELPFITVKRVPDGKVSNALLDTVEAGATLRVLGPSGRFVVPQDASAELLLIGGGSGITPLASIAETTLRTRPETRVRLIYGNRRLDDVIFLDRLRELAGRFDGRLSLTLALEEPPADFDGPVGRLDADTLRGLLGDVALETHCFVCGPTPMMDAARDVLTDLGVRPDRLHEERFSRVRRDDTPLADQPVVVDAGGARHRFTCHAGQTLLEAANAAELTLPFSCAMGGCAACKVELVEGNVLADESSCLSAEERAQGYVLTCVSKPLTPVELRVPA